MTVSVIVLGLAAAGLVILSRGAPLGHDESVYALRARYYAGAGPQTAWMDYRAEGLPLMGSVLVRLTDSEAGMRLLVLLSAVALAVLAWATARLLFGPRAGVVALALTAATPVVLQFAWQISLDIPSAMLGLAATLALAAGITTERVRPVAFLAVPLAVAATYVRYGAPIVVASGMTGLAVARWRTMVHDWRRTLALAVSTAVGCGAVLLIPWLTNSLASPGLAFRDREVAKDVSAWASYADYWELVPEVFGVAGVLVASGLALVAVRARRAGPSGVIAMVVASVLFVVVLNLSLAAGFSQYVIPLVPFVAIAAAAGIATVLPRDRVTGLVAVVMALALLTPAFQQASEAADRQEKRYGVIRHTGLALSAVAADPCVALTSYAPQVGWYSGCHATVWPNDRLHEDLDTTDALQIVETQLGASLPPGAPVYMVLFNRGKRQPPPEVQRALVDAGEVVAEVGHPEDGGRQHGVVVRIGETDAST